MRNTIHVSRPATTAIAAVLAFTATPLLAQETGSVADPVPSAAPVSTAPVSPVVLPSTSASAVTSTPASTTGQTVGPNVSRPVVQTVPAISPSTAPATVSSTTSATSATSGAAAPTMATNTNRQAVTASTVAEAASVANRPASARAAVPAAAALPAVSEPLTIDAEPVAADVTPPPMAERPVVVEQAAEPANDTDGTNTEFVLGVLLAALAAGGLGALLATSRRRARTRAAPVIERPIVATQSPRAGTVQSTAFSVAPSPQQEPEPSWRPLTVSSTPATGLGHSGAAVALPRKLPDSVSERRALLDRMVAAQPDRANPFRTPKARRHRAKLIMQSIGRTFATGQSRIDLSQYPMNWPELTARRTVAA
jgi:hypothetical protein